MRTLIIGYGNPFRGDDGIGYHVVNRVADTLGRNTLDLDDDGLDNLGHDVDLVNLPQLLPELAEIIGDYDLIIFVDAHTGACAEDLRQVPVAPAYTPSAFTHHMSPEMLLGLAQAFNPNVPPAKLISARGYAFDLVMGLSAPAAALAEQATDHIIALLSTAASLEDNRQE